MLHFTLTGSSDVTGFQCLLKLLINKIISQNWRKVDRYIQKIISYFLKHLHSKAAWKPSKNIFLPLRLFANLMIESYGCSTCKSNLMVCKSTRSKIMISSRGSFPKVANWRSYNVLITCFHEFCNYEFFFHESFFAFF